MGHQLPPRPVDSPWFAMDEAAGYLKYRSIHANTVVRAQLRKAGVPLYRRNGKSWLVRRVDLDEWLLTGQCLEGQRFWVEQQERAAKARAVAYRPQKPPSGKRRGRPRKHPLPPPPREEDDAADLDDLE